MNEVAAHLPRRCDGYHKMVDWLRQPALRVSLAANAAEIAPTYCRVRLVRPTSLAPQSQTQACLDS